MEKRLIDFTKVKLSDLEGKEQVTDVSKVVANQIYAVTPDIGMMELSRIIYREGKAEMTEDEIRYFENVIMGTDKLVAFLKEALRDQIFDIKTE